MATRTSRKKVSAKISSRGGSRPKGQQKLDCMKLTAKDRNELTEKLVRLEKTLARLEAEKKVYNRSTNEKIKEARGEIATVVRALDENS